MPVGCLALAALVGIAISRLRWPGTAAIVAVLLVLELPLDRFHETPADENNRAYATLRDQPATGRMLELPVFTAGSQRASAYLYYLTQAPREHPSGYSTTAPLAADRQPGCSCQSKYAMSGVRVFGERAGPTLGAVPTPVRHVALGALFLAPGESGGPETYLRGIVPALAEHSPDTRFTLFTTRKGARALHADGWSEFVKLVALPADEGERARRLLAEQVLLPEAARRHGAQVLHSLASVAPVAPRMPAVITLHDVTFFQMWTFPRATTIAMRLIVGTAGRRADALVAVSAAAGDEVARELGVARDRIFVAPNGAGRPPVVDPTAEVELRNRYAISARRIVLNVGAKRPHKNQELLVRALDHLPSDVGIVCAGQEEGYGDVLRNLASEPGRNGRVALPGYVPDEDLEGLWRLAGCAAFPTLAEGFGLPVAEALGRGVPVACSDIPVLNEVGGDVAHYFDPHDARSAAQAIEAALADEEARTSGPRQAARFTWPAAASATFAAYERALRG
jgi:glycosyltransferase involved in cell wall biosynthesis